MIPSVNDIPEGKGGIGPAGNIRKICLESQRLFLRRISRLGLCCQFPEFCRIENTILESWSIKASTRSSVRIRGCGRKFPDFDALSFPFLRDRDNFSPVQVQQGGIKAVLVKLHCVAFEEQVDLPGFLRRVRDGAEVCRDNKGLLPPVPLVDKEKDKRCEDHCRHSQV